MASRISRSLLEGVLAEAAAAPDREICGLLLGRGAEIIEARACPNVAAAPVDSFEIDPRALLAAYRASRSGGPAVLGHYHSHPSGNAVPSSRDAASAPPDGALWLIVARGEARAWRAVEGGAVHGRFDPVALAVGPGCAADSPPPQGAATPVREPQ